MILIIKALLKSFWSSFINAALSIILGKSKEAFINIIEAVENQNLTSEEKKAVALQQIKLLGLGSRDSLINLAIELAVNLIKNWRP